MSAKKHDVESEGAKARDHVHVRHHFIKHAHRDWRVWMVALMLLAILTYVLTDSLSLRPGRSARAPTPEAIVP